ncbi:MAG: hypothetical protein M0T85_00320 [Dehalococcoidales bacterium]|nr:hypothetical protein [Dehalococcoidales bacterium]
MKESALSKRMEETSTREQLPALEGRDYVHVAIRTIDGEEVEGLLSLTRSHNGARVRPFDYLERSTERLLRLRDVVVRNSEGEINLEAVAISNAAVARMHEKKDERARKKSWRYRRQLSCSPEDCRRPLIDGSTNCTTIRIRPTTKLPRARLSC